MNGIAVFSWRMRDRAHSECYGIPWSMLHAPIPMVLPNKSIILAEFIRERAAMIRCTLDVWAASLRGPAAILFISRDTCSDSIAIFFVLVFMGYRTIIARYVAKWGIARMCLGKIKYQGGVSRHFVGVLTSLKKYRAIWSIAAIVSQYRAIWGH